MFSYSSSHNTKIPEDFEQQLKKKQQYAHDLPSCKQIVDFTTMIYKGFLTKICHPGKNQLYTWSDNHSYINKVALFSTTKIHQHENYGHMDGITV